MKKFEKKLLGNQGGFTLIEIIAVLVILGILAAVAVPKFMNLTEDAQEKALDGAIAAGFSNVTIAYSRFVLKTSAAPTEIAGTYYWKGTGSETVGIETDLGDYTATYAKAAGSGPVTVTAARKDDPTVTGSKSFNLPE